MKAIIACCADGGIGYLGKLPWPILEGDLPRFKRLTDGQVIVMGKNTWGSLPKKPLSNRLSFVVSTSPLPLPPCAFRIPSIESIAGFDNAWVIGGAMLLRSAWPHINEIHLSRTYAKYTCDVFIDIVKLENDFIPVATTAFKDHSYEIWKRPSETISRPIAGHTS